MGLRGWIARGAAEGRAMYGDQTVTLSVKNLGFATGRAGVVNVWIGRWLGRGGQNVRLNA